MAKKSFKRNLAGVMSSPAAAFISTARGNISEAPRAPARAKGRAAPAREAKVRAAPDRSEPKTRRLQSLLKPSLYDFLVRSADRRGVSPNERLNALLEEARTSEEA